MVVEELASISFEAAQRLAARNQGCAVNVMPSESIEVELRYSELLVPKANVYEFMYPTVVGPRWCSRPKP